MTAPPHANHVNPGLVDVSAQAFAPPPGQAPPPSSAPLTSSNGELQLPASRQTEQSLPTGRGLPANVDVSKQSLVRPSPPQEPTDSRPPARDVAAGNARPGGLPVNVMIK